MQNIYLWGLNAVNKFKGYTNTFLWFYSNFKDKKCFNGYYIDCFKFGGLFINVHQEVHSQTKCNICQND